MSGGSPSITSQMIDDQEMDDEQQQQKDDLIENENNQDTNEDDNDSQTNDECEIQSEQTDYDKEKNSEIEVKILRGHLQSLTSYLISLILPTKLVFAKLKQYQETNKILEENYNDLKTSYLKLKSDIQTSFIKESILNGLESKFKETEKRKIQIAKNESFNFNPNLIIDHSNVLNEAQFLLQQLNSFQQEYQTSLNHNQQTKQHNIIHYSNENDQNNCSLNGECVDDGEIKQETSQNINNNNNMKIPILTDYNQNENDVILKVNLNGSTNTPKRKKTTSKVNGVRNSLQNQPLDYNSPYSCPTSTERPARIKVERAHICHYCNKEFTRAHHLSRHILLHTGEKPYVCTFENCTQAYNRKDSLTRHIRSHTQMQQSFTLGDTSSKLYV